MGLSVDFGVDGCSGTFTYQGGPSRLLASVVVVLVGGLFGLIATYGFFNVFLPTIVAGFVLWQLATLAYKSAPELTDLLLTEHRATFDVRGSRLTVVRADGTEEVELVGSTIGRSPTAIEVHRALGPPVVLQGGAADEAVVHRLADALQSLAARPGSQRAEVPAAIEGLADRG